MQHRKVPTRRTTAGVHTGPPNKTRPYWYGGRAGPDCRRPPTTIGRSTRRGGPNCHVSGLRMTHPRATQRAEAPSRRLPVLPVGSTAVPSFRLLNGTRLEIRPGPTVTGKFGPGPWRPPPSRPPPAAGPQPERPRRRGSTVTATPPDSPARARGLRRGSCPVLPGPRAVFKQHIDGAPGLGVCILLASGMSP